MQTLYRNRLCRCSLQSAFGILLKVLCDCKIAIQYQLDHIRKKLVRRQPYLDVCVANAMFMFYLWIVWAYLNPHIAQRNQHLHPL